MRSSAVRMLGLSGVRVVELGSGIAAGYCTRLLADAGADVVKVEPAEGDPLRRWSATGADVRDESGEETGAFFRFLHHSKRSIVGTPEAPEVRTLIAGADLVVESLAPGALDARAWCAADPGLVVLSISPFGRTGPCAARPATEFTLQAESGSIGTRGLRGREPFMAGGRIGEWLAGTFAAVAGLAAVQEAQRSGAGEHVDFSMLEVLAIGGTNYMDVLFQLLGAPAGGPLPQTVETPSIEPTADGYVGFCTNTRQQFSDFLLMIERTDLQDDAVLAQVAGRVARFDEWNEIVHAWTRRFTTAEVIERASLLRIPVAPILDGDTVRGHEQLRARGVFRRDPTGRFEHPRPPYRIDDADPPPAGPAPRLGEHTGRIEARQRARPTAPTPRQLPLAGLRILDMTAWWAGPSASHMLATLGAEVIHVESARRPDGMRMVGGMLRGKHERWWECSHFFLAANTNKRGLALDLASPRGVAIAKRLIEVCDVVIENFTPRVLDGFGLGWDVIRGLNPRAILVRMPAFGLSGPWRDHTGFAQTMEQLSGLAWLTGHRDDQPRIQRGPCDPLAGMHAAFALLVALEERRRSGRGVHVECTMVEGALNAAAEQVIEWTAYGRRLERDGNRAPEAAPQGLYACRDSRPGEEQWLALSIATDEQWRALVRWLGEPAWARAPGLASRAGRRAAHDTIDAALQPWLARRERDVCVRELTAAGVPAAAVADPRTIHGHPQHVARSFFEACEHAEVGRVTTPVVPFRFASVARWLRRPAPLLGEHNHEILSGLVGLGEDEIAALGEAGVIGERPQGL